MSAVRTRTISIMWALSLMLAGCSANPRPGTMTPALSSVVSVGESPELGAAVPDESAAATAAGASETALATATTASPPPLERTLQLGDKGDDVLRLQERLNALRFDVGKTDSIYGSQTMMAVWAFEKLVLGVGKYKVSGRVTPELWQRMHEPLGITERRPTAGRHFEIFLEPQVLVLWENHQPLMVTHMSHGDGRSWCEVQRAWDETATTTGPPPKTAKKVCGKSVTPGGTFKLYSYTKGWQQITLGEVYNPLYFNGGIAIHGYAEVPASPASHGCIRVPMHVSEVLPTMVRLGDRVFVWDGVQEPEVYGNQLPPLDEIDPRSTAPSTIATTTTTTIKGETTTAKPTTPTTLAPTSVAATSLTPAPPVSVTSARPSTSLAVPIPST
jgi:peptidoglycan hydrolase-like protein with peptidoglycan-binding domain